MLVINQKKNKNEKSTNLSSYHYGFDVESHQKSTFGSNSTFTHAHNNVVKKRKCIISALQRLFISSANNIIVFKLITPHTLKKMTHTSTLVRLFYKLFPTLFTPLFLSKNCLESCTNVAKICKGHKSTDTG